MSPIGQSTTCLYFQVVTKTMRFLAHSHGAMLFYLSKNIESTVRVLKHVMNHAAFGTELRYWQCNED